MEKTTHHPEMPGWDLSVSFGKEVSVFSYVGRRMKLIFHQKYQKDGLS